jgi:hypothetical protein
MEDEMNWRPDGWEYPKPQGPFAALSRAYEAGADAMYQPAHDKGYAEGRAELAMAALKWVEDVATTARRTNSSLTDILSTTIMYRNFEAWLREKGVL